MPPSPSSAALAVELPPSPSSARRHCRRGAALAVERTATPGVYTIDGRLLGREIGIDSLPAGIYIVNGKKVLVR